MNETVSNGNLQKMTGALKQRFAILTEDDQLFEEGLQQEEFGNYQIKIGNTQVDLFVIIENL